MHSTNHYVKPAVSQKITLDERTKWILTQNPKLVSELPYILNACSEGRGLIARLRFWLRFLPGFIGTKNFLDC